ncbi:MAG: hypothetical protein ACR2OC_08975 [Solirubrobacterales bacterium]
MPALPLDEAGKYVAAAYTVFAGLLLVYVSIMAVRLSRMQEQIRELADRAEAGSVREPATRSIGERIAPAPSPSPAAAEAEQSSRGSGS